MNIISSAGLDTALLECYAKDVTPVFPVAELLCLKWHTIGLYLTGHEPDELPAASGHTALCSVSLSEHTAFIGDGKVTLRRTCIRTDMQTDNLRHQDRLASMKSIRSSSVFGGFSNTWLMPSFGGTSDNCR